jgi:hypothetical protein
MVEGKSELGSLQGRDPRDVPGGGIHAYSIKESVFELLTPENINSLHVSHI